MARPRARSRVVQICIGIYVIFNEIIKATYIRSRAIYKLKIIARARSIKNKLLGLIYAPIATAVTTL